MTRTNGTGYLSYSYTNLSCIDFTVRQRWPYIKIIKCMYVKQYTCYNAHRNH